ncbi:kinesin-like protein KIF12 [Thrips palmi]|uniref:Kinesin-like protein n=1 Tax=Thrips palmi TaxID=161013 RepID=A0A6P8YT10_THRPL|nr:kinesin-like protein KIF12 [Thrips palmi]
MPAARGSQSPTRGKSNKAKKSPSPGRGGGSSNSSVNGKDDLDGIEGLGVVGNGLANGLAKGGLGNPPPAAQRARVATSGSDRSGGSLSDSPEDAARPAPPAPSGEDNINVVVRVRPLSQKESKAKDNFVVQFPGNGQLLLEGGPVPAGGSSPGAGNASKSRLFSFNAVFEPGATQEDLLNYSGVRRLISMAVEGFSCTVFCYGQTGSGKTHTLTGPPGLFDGTVDPQSPDHGLVCRSFRFLFEQLSERGDFHFVLKASFLEIYNEKVIDLLNPGSARKPLAVRWSKKSRGFFVENLFTVDCETLDDLLAVLEEGMRNRSMGSHGMNDHSSRSHTILTVHIAAERQVSENGVFISRQGKLNFVDLAGSEMTKKTHSEGKTLEEANNINKSLMVLGYCIASLSDPRKKEKGHIPYRDSKLTKLLADSLAGNGVTLMIACISPAKSNISESLNTLRYAARAKKIRTKPVIMMDPREALILSLKREVAALQSENDHLRSAIRINGEHFGTNGSAEVARPSGSPPTVDLERLAELEANELAGLVQHYMLENEALRRENSDLFSTRDILMRDQDLVCRENERLLKKLEDVNSVCCRSPIIPARPTFSGELLNLSLGGSDGAAAMPSGMPPHDLMASSTNVWVHPLNGSNYSAASTTALAGPKFKAEILEGRHSAKPPHRLPDSIQKELDKRRIGKSMTNIAESYRDRSHQRHNSWDSSKGAAASNGGPGDGQGLPQTPPPAPLGSDRRSFHHDDEEKITQTSLFKEHFSETNERLRDQGIKEPRRTARAAFSSPG